MTSGVQALSDLDTLFYKSETSSQHLHVLATLVLDRSSIPGGGDYEMFQSRVAERFHLISPLGRRPIDVLGGALWIDDPDMYIQEHLHHLILAEGGNLDALADATAEIASHPLPRDRPLWEAWFIEGFEKDHVAVVAKIHHSVVDGVSGIFALAAFFDLEPFPETAVPSTPEPPGSPGLREVFTKRLDSLMHRPVSIVKGAARFTNSAVKLMRSRSTTTPLPCTGPRMSYNRSLTPRRSVSFTTLGLDDVKKVARELDASINDIVVALCAGLLRRYAIQCDELPRRPLVAAIPVSERGPEDGAAGNHLSFMFYALPVHLDDPRERVEFVKASAAGAKEVHAKAGEGLLAAVASVAPKAALGPAMRAISSTGATNVLPPVANVLISNIKGPELPLYVAGAALSSIFPMGPVIEGVGLGITAVSYRDEFAFGFIACTESVTDIREMSLGLHLEMATMLDSIGQEGHTPSGR